MNRLAQPAAMLAGTPRCARQGFSVTELMVAISIFFVVVAAAVTMNLTGMRMLSRSEPVLNANGEARKMLDLLVQDLRSAKIVRVGQGDFSSFSNTPLGSPMQGNALQVYPGADSNLFARYYLDPGDRSLKRMTNGAAAPRVVATAVTNDLVFAAYDGETLLTHSQNQMAVDVRLQFAALPDAAALVGPSNFFQSYEWQTRVHHRTR